MVIPGLPFSGQQLRTTLAELLSAISDHIAAADPHPVYLNAAEANATYAAIGAPATAVAAHEQAANPHPVYLTQSEGDERYALIGATAGLAAYVYSQSVPATTWVINHNLGRYPSVELFNSGMQEIDAEIVHPSTNQTLVTLNPATAGLARLI